MTDVRTLLHDLAAEAPRGHGEQTADRVVDLHRAQDRRRLRWAGAAAAVALVVAVVPALVTRSSPADEAAAAAAAAAEVPSLFDAPTRGSLAADEAAVEALQLTGWGEAVPGRDAGDILTPAEENRHVAFAGEVPGGQTWGLVVGRTGPQLAYAWFVGDRDSEGFTWRLVNLPQRTTAGLPLGLLDLAGDHGPLLVVGLPQEQVDLVDPTDRTPLDVVRSATAEGGVVLADVDTSGVPGGIGYEVAGATSSPRSALRPLEFDSTDRGTYADVTTAFFAVVADPVTGTAVQRCLVSAGQLVLAADGSPLWPVLPTEADAQAFLAASDSCRGEPSDVAAAVSSAAASSAAAVAGD